MQKNDKNRLTHGQRLSPNTHTLTFHLLEFKATFRDCVGGSLRSQRDLSKATFMRPTKFIFTFLSN